MTPKSTVEVTSSTPKLTPKPLLEEADLKKLLAAPKDSSDYWQGRWHLWQLQRQKVRGQKTKVGV